MDLRDIDIDRAQRLNLPVSAGFTRKTPSLLVKICSLLYSGAPSKCCFQSSFDLAR